MHGTGYLQSLAKGEFKKDAFEVQKEMLNGQAKVIFDVGANRGDVSDIYQQLFPDASIYAFEPFPESYNILTAKHGNNKRISCEQLAVAADNIPKVFYVNRNVDTNSLLKPQNTGLSSDKQVENITTIEVKATTLDDFCQKVSIKHIDVLKMDIQGGEFEALQGAKRMLREGDIELIYSEVYFIEQYASQPLFHDISKLLHSYGYYLQDLYSPIYGKGNIAWGDAIFCKKKS